MYEGREKAAPVGGDERMPFKEADRSVSASCSRRTERLLLLLLMLALVVVVVVSFPTSGGKEEKEEKPGSGPKELSS